MNPCPGTDVDNKIGLTDGFFIMFNNNDRITHISQSRQRTEKSLIVSLVQPYRRFIKDVHDAHESRTDLACKPDSLCFAT